MKAEHDQMKEIMMFYVINPHTMESVGEGHELLDDAVAAAECRFPLGDAPIHDEDDNEICRLDQAPVPPNWKKSARRT
jgi:hypothetical protein